MSYHIRFTMSTGLRRAIRVPVGTLDAITKHVEWVEITLGLRKVQYRDNPFHWANTREAIRDYSGGDKRLCEVVQEHNDWVEQLYLTFDKPNKPRGAKAEIITPEQAQTFWHALAPLEVPLTRWTPEYRQRQMDDLHKVMTSTPVNGCIFDAAKLSNRQARRVIETVPWNPVKLDDYRDEIEAYRSDMKNWYEVLRGRVPYGMDNPPKLDAKILTERQAAAVVVLFSEYLDTHDIRLDVPDGHDYLASSYDGGYDWCSTCGKAIADDDICDRVNNCQRNACEIKAEYKHDHDD